MTALYIIAFCYLILAFAKKILDKFAEKPLVTFGLIIAIPLIPYLTYLVSGNEVAAGISLGVIGFIFIVFIFELY